MKAIIFSFIPAVENSMVASTRIARYLRDELQLPLIWKEDIADHTNLDVLFLINGAFAFCNFLEPLSHAILQAKRIVWIQNDYTIVPPINNGQATSPFRKAFVTRREEGKSHLELWSTCEKESKATMFSAYTNWNCLSMLDKPIPKSSHAFDIAYYGSFRKDRKQLFDFYFKNPKTMFTISSPSKKFK